MDPVCVQKTKKRFRNFKQINIIQADVEHSHQDNWITKGTIFYLFNPFCLRIIEKFESNISLFGKKDIKIIFYNCNGKLSPFENNPFWTIKKLGILSHTALEAAIITRN